MKQERRIFNRTVNIAILTVILVLFCTISGRLILKKMEGYIETNGKNNMATVMEQMAQSYDIQAGEYYKKLEQTEKFLFQGGKRELDLKDSEASIHSVQLEGTEELLFMKANGEVMSIDGTKRHLDMHNQMLFDLKQNKRIAQSIAISRDGKRENYYLVAIPCEPYTVDGESYSAIAALYEQSRIDSILELNGYGGGAFIFMVDENGIVNYTNQSGDHFYRNYALLKHLKKDRALSEEQYDRLLGMLKNCEEEEVELIDKNDRPFYLGSYPVRSSDHKLICIVSRSAVDNTLLEYQKMMAQWIALYAGIVCLLCVGLVYNVFRAGTANKRAEYEEEKRQMQAKAMEALTAERNRADAANRAKSDFLSNMSHDIRTPMNAIVGLTELMMHEKNSSDRMKGYLQKIQSSSRHLLSLINDVLDMSKIESGEVKLHLEPVYISEILQQTDSIIRAQAGNHGQKFQLTVDTPAHKRVLCDGVRLRQILLNLLSNAVKYTPDGGSIQLRVSELPGEQPDKARFVFAVSDTGCGMKEEFLEHIFEPFTRAEQSVTNRIQGTGLGMAITKNMIDLMGGSIYVKSEVGKGSRFEVVLDFRIPEGAEDAGGAERAPEIPVPEGESLKGRRFLCAEDNELNAEILKELLAMYGASCTICSDGEAIVETFRHVKPGEYDAILMDVQMPKMNGIEAAKKIRNGENPLGKTIRIIAMTANAFSEDVQRCMEAGMDAHIAKPLEIAVLEKRLRETPLHGSE